MAAGSWRSRFQRIPAPMVDAILGLALTLAVTVAIRFGVEQGGPPGPAAYALGPALGALTMVRRRWPLAVLLSSAAVLQFYNAFPNPGMFAAVPLSVALATAWVASRRRWALLIAVWFSFTPVVFVALSDLPEAMTTAVISGVVSDMALMAALLMLGEAIRGRRALKREQERSEALLLNVLPAPIADRLKDGEQTIADGFPDVTVMFADLVGFTHLSRGISPEQVVEELNDLFSAFDGLARLHGLEKIKTIGDAYMVAGGLPDPRPDHAEAVAAMALAMREEVAGRVDPEGRSLEIRIGIDTGPVVAGIIGRDKFSYDLWGDTVNTASRMESHGLPGSIQVTERCYQRLRDSYRLERRGSIEVKGKGGMVTWLLLGPSSRPER